MFDPDCRHCSRLATLLDEVKAEYPDYHARPVAPFGAKKIQLLIVGLAPGMHGANATGRPFTGDLSGEMLYRTMYEFGFCNKPVSESADDGLKCRITNAVKCLPPQNRPTTDEVKCCSRFLKQELDELKPGTVVLALGSIAHNAILRTLNLKQGQYKFGHLHEYALPAGLWLLDSYHCSRYNTQTKRLTEAMFQQVFARAQALMGTPAK